MAVLSFRHKGDFRKTMSFFNKLKDGDIYKCLERYGREGVQALSSATPVDSGKTANSWDYEIVKTNNSVSIYWTNSNINNGVPIAVILQYGHGTGTGGYVQGIDYINPALKPVFEKIATNVWKEVIS